MKNMEDTRIDEWQEELKYLKERIGSATNDAKQEIQKRISELETRLKEN